PTHFGSHGFSTFTWSGAAVIVSLENSSFISYVFGNDEHCFSKENSSSLLFTFAQDRGGEGENSEQADLMKRGASSQLIVERCGPKSPVVGKNWDVGDRISLSHITDLTRYPGLAKNARGQTAALVTHQSISDSRQAISRARPDLKGRLAVNRDVIVDGRP